MENKSGGLGSLLSEAVVFAVLLIVFVVVATVALAVRVAREVHKWHKLRTLLQEWSEEHERREPA